MKDDKIIIPAKKLSHLKPGQNSCIKISPRAYNLLVDIANESGRPLNRVSSAIIEQAIDKDLIELERCFSNDIDEAD